MEGTTIICDECRNKENEEESIRSIKIKRCPHCNSITFGSWTESHLTHAEVINNILDRVFNLENFTFSESGDEYNKKVKFSGYSKGRMTLRESEFSLNTSLSTCPVCTKKLGNYYEAILQLRGENGNRLESSLKYATDAFEKTPSRDIFVTKIEKKKEGYDVFISDKQYARKVARGNLDKFGGVYKETSHLVGRKNGSDLYRITISVRIPDFETGDVLKIKNNLVLVKGIKGNQVNLLNIITNSVEKGKISEMKEYRLLEKDSDIKEADVLYREGDTAYILDPFDFKERAITDTQKKETVRIVKVDEEIFVVPS